jgi:hypothetical protein
MLGPAGYRTRELVRERIEGQPRLRAIVGDRAYLGLAGLAARKGVSLDIKAKPAAPTSTPPDPSATGIRGNRPTTRWVTWAHPHRRLGIQLQALTGQ